MTWAKLWIGAGLFALAIALEKYAFLAPRVGVFMDDAHEFRQKLPEIQRTAEEIKTSLKNLELRFSFFEREMREQGR